MIRRLAARLGTALQPILDLLDSGLLLYRRSFLRFLAMATFLVVPVGAVLILPLGLGLGIMGFTSIAFASTALAGAGAPFILLLPAVVLLGAYPVYAMSRASLLLQRGEPVTMRAVFQIAPLRLAGMVGYALGYALVAGAVAAIIISALAWVASGLVGTLTEGAMGTSESDPFMLIVGFTLGLFAGLIGWVSYVLGLVVGGAVLSATIYGLQPFVQHTGSLREAVRRSIALTRHRFGRNLLAFLVGSSVAMGLMLVVNGATSMLATLLVVFTPGAISTAFWVVSVVGWALALLVTVPLVPIWMTLLYQRNDAAYTGADLAVRIAALAAAPTEEEVAAHAGTNA